MRIPVPSVVSLTILLFSASAANAQLKQLEQLSKEWYRLNPTAHVLSGLPSRLPVPPVPNCNVNCEVLVYVLPPGDPSGHPTKCAAVVALENPITVAFGAKNHTITWRIQSPYAVGVDTGVYAFRNNSNDGIRMQDEVEFGRRYQAGLVKDIARVSKNDTTEVWRVKNERVRDELTCTKDSDDDGDGAGNVRRCEIHYAPYVKRTESGVARNCVPLDPTLINKGS